MKIIYKEITVSAQEVADVFIEKIKVFEIEADAENDFCNKFDFEHEWEIDGKKLTIFFFGRLAGYVTNDKIGDEPDSYKIESRYILYNEFAAYFDGDDVKINENEIFEIINKSIEL